MKNLSIYKNSIFISKTLETQAFITVGFLLFTVFASNPFETMGALHNDGLGFNPVSYTHLTLPTNREV